MLDDILGKGTAAEVATNMQVKDTVSTPGFSRPTTAGFNDIPNAAMEILPSTNEALDALSPELDFDYDEALKSFTPTELLDEMSNRKEYSDNFNYAGARKKLGDAGLVNSLRNEAVVARREIAKNEYSDINDYTKGFGTTMASLGIAAADLLNALHVTDDKEHNARVSKLRTFIKDVDSARDNKDFWSLGTLGSIGAEFAALPVSIESRLGIFLSGSVMGYADSRGKGDDKTDSAIMGAAVGTVGVAANDALKAVFKSLSTSALDKVYNYYKESFNISDAKAEEIIKGYSSVMSSSSNKAKDIAENKLMAIFEYSGDRGANLKKLFAGRQNSAIGKLEKPTIDRHKAIVDLTETDFNLEEFGKVVTDSVRQVKNNYGIIKQEIGTKYNSNHMDIPIELPEMLEEISTDRVAINKLLGNGSTLEDYMDSMPHINSILSKVKGTHKNDWNRIKSSVNTKIQNTLSDEDYIQWASVNRDYSEMQQVMNSKLGKAVDRAVSSKSNNVTVPRALDLLKADKDSGEVTYSMLNKLVGTEQAAKFEKSAIRDIVNVHTDEIAWDTFYKTAKTNGFATEEGKRLVGLLRTLDANFKTDEALAKMYLKDPGGGSLATTVSGKLKMTFLGKLFSKAFKHAPFNAEARNIRMQDKLFNVLKSKRAVNKFEDIMNTMTEGVKAKHLNELTSNTKLLEQFSNYKKDTINMNTNKANRASMLDSNDVSEGVSEAYKDVMFSKLEHSDRNKITEAAFKHFDSTRTQTKLKSIANSMQVGRVDDNARKLQNAIKGEAILMAKAISDDTGLKVRDDMMEYLYNHVANKLMKDC